MMFEPYTRAIYVLGVMSVRIAAVALCLWVFYHIWMAFFERH
jgi:hypothetical protein